MIVTHADLDFDLTVLYPIEHSIACSAHEVPYFPMASCSEGLRHQLQVYVYSRSSAVRSIELHD